MPERANLPQTIIFIHIPKAAGTSFKSILFRNFAPDQIYHVQGEEGEDEFKALPDAEKQRFRLICGHHYFGLHEHIPQPATYIAFLRDPIARTVSHYNFVRRVKHHRLHERAMQVTLEDYLVQEIAGKTLDNGQTRRLAGVRGEIDCTEEIFELAKANMKQHFSVIGVSEHFDETILTAKRILHWNNIHYLHLNRTSLSSPVVADRVFDLIKERNQFDIQLHQYAQHLLDIQYQEQFGNNI